MSLIYNIKQQVFKYKKSYVNPKDIAKIYDKISKVHSSSKSNNFLENYKKILPYVNLSSNSKILEIGCGDGILSKIIPDDCKYLGIDISSNMITEALNKNKKNRKNVSFEKVDAKEFVKYSTINSYDLIIFSFSKKYFEKDYLNTIMTLLKKDGHLIIIDDFKDNFANLFDLFRDFKLMNKNALVKINPYSFYQSNSEELNSTLNEIGFVQSIFLKFEKSFDSNKEFLVNSAIVPELVSEFGNASELYSKKFMDYIQDNNFILPKQNYFICIAKK